MVVDGHPPVVAPGGGEGPGQAPGGGGRHQQLGGGQELHPVVPASGHQVHLHHH